MVYSIDMANEESIERLLELLSADEPESEQHFITILRRPFDQVRPTCSCGWLGTTCRSVADAEEEGAHHVD